MYYFVIAAVTVSLLFTTPTNATAGPEEDASYIISQSVPRSSFEAVIEGSRPEITQVKLSMLSRAGIVLPNPERFMDYYMAAITDEFTETMQNETKRFYLDRFSPTELADLAEFYKTPSGQHHIAMISELDLMHEKTIVIDQENAVRNARHRIAKRLKEEGISLTNDKSMMDRLFEYLE